jgi:hypothetical protein
MRKTYVAQVSRSLGKKMQIGATEFQQQCLQLMSQVEQTGEEVVIIIEWYERLKSRKLHILIF